MVRVLVPSVKQFDVEDNVSNYSTTTTKELIIFYEQP
jgi:hypothetical protein